MSTMTLTTRNRVEHGVLAVAEDDDLMARGNHPEGRNRKARRTVKRRERAAWRQEANAYLYLDPADLDL